MTFLSFNAIIANIHDQQKSYFTLLLFTPTLPITNPLYPLHRHRHWKHRSLGQLSCSRLMDKGAQQDFTLLLWGGLWTCDRSWWLSVTTTSSPSRSSPLSSATQAAVCNCSALSCNTQNNIVVIYILTSRGHCGIMLGYVVFMPKSTFYYMCLCVNTNFLINFAMW